jgi:hypothetical protein
MGRTSVGTIRNERLTGQNLPVIRRGHAADRIPQRSISATRPPRTPCVPPNRVRYPRSESRGEDALRSCRKQVCARAFGFLGVRQTLLVRQHEVQTNQLMIALDCGRSSLASDMNNGRKRSPPVPSIVPPIGTNHGCRPLPAGVDSLPVSSPSSFAMRP